MKKKKNNFNIQVQSFNNTNNKNNITSPNYSNENNKKASNNNKSIDNFIKFDDSFPISPYKFPNLYYNYDLDSN